VHYRQRSAGIRNEAFAGFKMSQDGPESGDEHEEINGMNDNRRVNIAKNGKPDILAGFRIG